MIEQRFRFTFGGIENATTMTFALTHGASPSRGVIVFFPQRDIPHGGDLTIYDNTSPIIRMRDCKLFRLNGDGGNGGVTYRAAILDRRWRWSHQHISGHYNPRRQDGTIQEFPTWERKSARRIVEDIFEILNEPIDASLVPDDDYPEFVFDDEYIPPVLDSVLEQYGLRLAWNADDTPSIVRLGTGAELPPNRIGAATLSQGIDAHLSPDRIGVVGGQMRFESIWECEPVGVETDGSIKRVDELSYRPDAGWDRTDPYRIQNIADHGDRHYASMGLFRMYRVVRSVENSMLRFFGNGSSALAPSGAMPDDVKHLTLRHMNFEPHLIDYRSVLDAYGQTISEPAPAECYVYSHYQGDIIRKARGHKWRTFYTAPFAGQSTADIEDSAPPFTFSLDGSRGIVHFSSPQFIANETSPYKNRFAKVYLRCVCTLMRDDMTPLRYRKFYDLKPVNGGSGDLAIRDDSIWPYYKTEASLPEHDVSTDENADRPKFTGVNSNTTTVDDEATQRIFAKASEFVPRPVSAMGRYWDILPISTDGAIHQVEWHIDVRSGFETTVSRNSEVVTWVEPYNTKRMREKEGLNVAIDGLRKELGIVRYQPLY